jgi:hypothetical protein
MVQQQCRTWLHSTDIDLSNVVGIVPADGWNAGYSDGRTIPVIFWVLRKDGRLSGSSARAGSQSTSKSELRTSC